MASLAAALRPDLVAGLFLEDVTPLFLTNPELRTYPFLSSVLSLGALATEAPNERAPVDWLEARMAALPHDVSGSWGERLPQAEIRDWAK